MLAKRLFDVTVALAGLVLLAPLLLLLAAWIRWDSPGPALFRQLRVGRHAIPFHIYKFRTMVVGAEATGQLSVAEDHRATRAGRWLRRHKLDELPQLFNVLRGEMSLVGPRPEVPHYVARYPSAVRQIVLSVPPGITDWAALRFRNEGDLLRNAADPEHTYLTRILPVKLKYYVRYVQRRTLAIDLHILLCTVGTLLFGAARKRPWLRVLRHSALGPHDGLSPVIAWLRGLAALQVAAAHLRSDVFPGLSTIADPPLWYQGLAFATGFAHQAVVVFFVLSGWLVGGVLLDRLHRPHALRDYAIDRLTRLWIVLLPSFVLMLAMAWATGALPPDAAEREAWSLPVLLGNLAGLQTQGLPVFGGNFPLWSLANETWYYVLFPLLVLSVRGRSGTLRLACAALALAIAACLSADIVGYLLVWLLGVGASRLRLHLAPLPRALALGAFLGLAAVLRLGGQDGEFDHQSLGPDLVYSVLFIVCLCSVGRLRAGAWRRWSALGGSLAGFSFTLYVLHVPLQRALWAYRNGAQLSPHEPASLAVYGALLLMVVALAYLFHLPFEAQTGRLRSAVRGRLASHTSSPQAPRKQPGSYL
jgi:lipopolysaccharide/colanic/teichoic acid biosynthesis glycosyltransferase/peptidoglycan/LPS O-acetylase OafA/YrhL